MVQTAKEGMMNNASSSEVYGKMQEVFIKMDDKSNVSIKYTVYTRIYSFLSTILIILLLHTA